MDLLRSAEEVYQSGVGRLLRRGDLGLALLTPVNPSFPAPHYPHRQAPSTDEPAATLNIIGIAESAEPTDVARHEPQYLAEAYAAET